MPGRTGRRAYLLVETDVPAVLEAYAEGFVIGSVDTAVSLSDAALLLFQESVNEGVVAEHKAGLLDGGLTALVILVETLAYAFEVGAHIFLLLVLGEEAAVAHGLVLGLVDTVHGEAGENLQEILVELPADDDVGFRADNGHPARRAVVETAAQVELADDVHQLELPGVAVLIGIGDAVGLGDAGGVTLFCLADIAHLEVILQKELLHHPGSLVSLAGGTDLLGTVLQLQQLADLGDDVFSLHSVPLLLDDTLYLLLCIHEGVQNHTVDELRWTLVTEILDGLLEDGRRA